MFRIKQLTVFFFLVCCGKSSFAQANSTQANSTQANSTQADDLIMALPGKTYAVNKDFLLLYEGLTCMRNKYDISGFNTYALCQTPDKKFLLKKTTVNNYSRPAYPQYSGVRCVDTDSTLFLFCAKQPIKEGAISGTSLDWSDGAIDYGKIDVPKTDWTLVVDCDDPDNAADWQKAALVLIQVSTGKKQVLATVTRSTNPTDDLIFSPPYTLHFCGDLDNDGKTDLIISGESESAGEERLFLSSLARNMDFVQEVARWNYCLSD
jgi:hypothetical protein